MADIPQNRVHLAALAAGLLSKQPLVTRLGAVIEAATTAYLEALDGEEKAKPRLSWHSERSPGGE